MTSWSVDDDDRDPALDAYLDELLGGATPPDLSSRILAAWQQRQADSAASTPSAAAVSPSVAAVRPSAKVEADGAARSPRSQSSSNGPLTKGASLGGLEVTEGGDRQAVIRDATHSQTDVRPTPRHPTGRANSAHQESAHQDYAGNRWLPLVTLAASLIVGLGLGLAALNWFGPSGETQDQFSGLPPTTDGTIHPEPSPKTPETRLPDQLAQRPTEVPLDELVDPPIEAEPDAPLAGLRPNQEFRRAPTATPLELITLVSHVDQNLGDLWRQQGIRPSPGASDREWGGRVFHYLLGREPTPDELQAFLGDASPNKRQTLIERLHTESGYVAEYAAHWAGFWTTTWLGPANVMPGSSLASREGFELYLRRALEVNASLSLLAMQMLAASGSGSPMDPEFHGATNFLLTHRPGDADGAAATSALARLLLGQRLDCAQCHDHPSDPDLTQQRFWELNAFFRQVHVVPPADGRTARLDDRDAAEEEVFFEEPNGYQRAVYPVLPNGMAIPRSVLVEEVRRREYLADWVARSAEFPRATVNRIWAHFFGYGLVHPLDDIGPHNPPIDPELLDTLTEQFVAHDYSLRHLTRWIVSSDAFGRGSDYSDSNLADVPERGEIPLFSRFYFRPSSAGPAGESLKQLAEIRSSPGGLAEQARLEMPGLLARLLAPNPLLFEGPSVDQNGGEPQITLSGAVLLQPGKNRTEGVVLRQILKSDLSTDQKIEHLFWAAVARKPTPQEVELSRKMVAESVEPVTVLQDIWWTLLHSNEFLRQP